MYGRPGYRQGGFSAGEETGEDDLEAGPQGGAVEARRVAHPPGEELVAEHPLDRAEPGRAHGLGMETGPELTGPPQGREQAVDALDELEETAGQEDDVAMPADPPALQEQQRRQLVVPLDG